MVKKYLGLAFICLLFVSAAFGQSNSGRLEGTVVDQESGEPLTGCNIVILGGSKQRGATTDDEGEYSISNIPPGTYDVQFSYIGYGKKRLKEVEINAGRSTVKDVQLSSKTQTTSIVDVTEHRNLFSKDKTTQDEIVGNEEIKKLPTKSTQDLVALSAGTYTQGDGISIKGQRSDGTMIMVDGVRVRGMQSVPQNAIEQTQTMTSGIPAKHGDAIGGIVSITTRGATPELTGSMEAITSQFIDGYGYNYFEGNVSGPLYTEDKGTDSARARVGFNFGGTINYQKDPRPTAIDNWVVKDDVLSDLKERPLRRDPRAAGFQSSAKFVTKDEMKQVQARPNVDRLDYDLTGKITYDLSDNIDIIAGGQAGRQSNMSTSYANSLFNYENYRENIQTNYRGYFRFEQSFDDDNDDGINNVFYSVQMDYAKDLRTVQDPEFEDDFFKYGHIGNFERQRTPSYTFRQDSLNGTFTQAWYQTGFNDTAVAFNQADRNRGAGNFTRQLYRFQGGDIRNFEQIRGQGGLLNGDRPQLVYSMWRDVGTPAANYSEINQDQFTISADGSFDIGRHSIELGMQYEQLVARSFGLTSASGLWNIMRQSANSHIQQLDTDNPQPVYDDQGNFLDTVKYPRLVNKDDQTEFDRNFREHLRQKGEDVDQRTFLNVDNYDPEEFSLDMFSADELLNQGQVTYYGYDYKGNVSNEDPSINDFLNDPSGRPMGAYNPIYTVGYIQDKFKVKDLFFRVGVRVDRFDANQPVLKDRYSLYPTRKAGEVNDLGDHPGNIGDDYVVYVDDPVDPRNIVGYRTDDRWFNDAGEEVNDPNTLGSGDISPYLTFDNSEDISLVEEGFEDYEPQVNVQPRIAFSFPISNEARFRASYDVLTQRPKSGNRSTIQDYFFLEERATQSIPNPGLEPERKDQFELGFTQKLSNRSSLDLNAYYSETRNLIQLVQINQAYPISYTTFRNFDFQTTKGLTAEYDLRPTARSNLRFRLNYTLQFTDGTGSNAVDQSSLITAGQPNLRTPFPLDNDIRHNFQSRLSYTFGSGRNYSGPVDKNGNQILKNVGFNVIMNALSGRPYSEQSNVTRAVAIGIRQQSNLEGGINQARMPWTYNVDIRLDKTFPINLSGEDQSSRGRGSSGSDLTVYLRITNLFDTRNVQSVYDYTGDPNDDGFLSSQQGQQVAQEQVSQQAFIDQYSIKANNPFNYSQPRLVRVGAQLNF